jgi:ADP-ribose pyrophosphatase YjhB (NUDIX family)
MKQTTLCILVDDANGKILLGLKKRGFGQGKLDGFGGKVEKGETVIEAAARELEEESCVKASLNDLEKVAEFAFEFRGRPEWNQVMHVYFVRKWVGQPKETEEMVPEWFSMEGLPLDRTWADDRHWLPQALQRKKLKGKFVFKEDGDSLHEFQVEEVEGEL